MGMMKEKLIILTGFSASGKDTLMNMLLKKRADINRVVTHTSRPPRKGEAEGVDYFFVSRTEFETMINNDELVEHVKYGSDYKGTHKKQLARVEQGNSMIWRIDMSRAAVLEETIFEKYPEEEARSLLERTVKILIKTPSQKTALARYKAREKDIFDSVEFTQRLEADLKIWKTHRHKFPHVVVNRNNRQVAALNEILKIIDK